MNIERQLASIKSKSELHKWIDELPDEAEGVLLMRLPSEPLTEDEQKATAHDSGAAPVRDCFRFRHFGNIELGESVYMVRCFEHWLLNIRE